jgi:hypothetical protein
MSGLSIAAPQHYNLNPMTAQNKLSRDAREIALNWIRDNFGWQGQLGPLDIMGYQRVVGTQKFEGWPEITLTGPLTVWALKLRKVTEDAVSLERVAQELSTKLGMSAEKVEISQINENEWEVKLSYPCDTTQLMHCIEEAFPFDDMKVLKILAKFKAMPFLELSSIANLNENYLQEIINNLEKQDLVKVTNRGNIFEEVVTLREKGFAVA